VQKSASAQCPVPPLPDPELLEVPELLAPPELLPPLADPELLPGLELLDPEPPPYPELPPPFASSSPALLDPSPGPPSPSPLGAGVMSPIPTIDAHPPHSTAQAAPAATWNRSLCIAFTGTRPGQRLRRAPDRWSDRPRSRSPRFSRCSL